MEVNNNVFFFYSGDATEPSCLTMVSRGFRCCQLGVTSKGRLPIVFKCAWV